MSPVAGLSLEPDEARAFAESVAGVADRHAAGQPAWEPGISAPAPAPELAAALTELGWDQLAEEPELIICAGLGAVELGRRLAPLHHVDRLLGGSPMAGDLVRSLGPEQTAIVNEHGVLCRQAVVRSAPVASAAGLDLQRVLELGHAAPVPAGRGRIAQRAWLAAGVGYLAGVGQSALDLTTEYVRQRHAFGGTLAALAPVQQLLADAATGVRGVRLLAGQAADAPAYADALAHAGPAVAAACAACQQATGAIGYTLEYPLHRHTQLARGLAAFNEALLDALASSGG